MSYFHPQDDHPHRPLQPPPRTTTTITRTFCLDCNNTTLIEQRMRNVRTLRTSVQDGRDAVHFFIASRANLLRFRRRTRERVPAVLLVRARFLGGLHVRVVSGVPLFLLGIFSVVALSSPSLQADESLQRTTR